VSLADVASHGASASSGLETTELSIALGACASTIGAVEDTIENEEVQDTHSQCHGPCRSTLTAQVLQSRLFRIVQHVILILASPGIDGEEIFVVAVVGV